MTKDDIIRMAQESVLDATKPFSRPKDPKSMTEFCLSFAERIAAAEREACAKLCEPQDQHDDPLTAWKIATAIRARGQE